MKTSQLITASSLILMGLMQQAVTVSAAIPEPDNLLYGTITIDGIPLTAEDNNVSILLSYQGSEVASYRLGSDPITQDRYLITLPMTMADDSGDGYSIGDVLTVSYSSGAIVRAVAEMTVAERGTSTELNLSLYSADIPVGVDPDAADQDGDGIPDAVELAQGLNPFDPSDASLDTDGDGINNMQEFIAGTDIGRDEQAPLVIAPATLVVAATGLFTEVELGLGAAFDEKDGPLTPAADGDGFYSTGEHIVTWSATDSAGNQGTDTQLLRVNPQVNFYPGYLVTEGETVKLIAGLNGLAARYPVTIPFTVSGSAEGEGVDHNLADGEIIIDSGLFGSVEFSVTADALTDEEIESVRVTMGDPTNAVVGLADTFVAEITQDNIPPRVALSVNQGASDTTIVVKGGEPVIVSATVEDASADNTLSFNWSETDSRLVDSDNSPSTFSIDAAELAPGMYTISLGVSDPEGSTGFAQVAVNVLATAPVLTESDTDGDGIADNVEGFADTDGDGLPEYLDVLEQTNALPAIPNSNQGFVLETEVGLHLSLGAVALDTGEASASVSMADIQGLYNDVATNDDEFTGGLFEFSVSGLAFPGATVTIVLPQMAAIPAAAFYSKLSVSDLTWNTFVEDDNNAVFSAAGSPGYCPSPNDAAYTAGLTEGDWCVMLQIEDGGPNDADGTVNQRVDDPGGVQVETAQAPAAPVSNDEVKKSGGGGGGGQFEFIFLLLLSLAVAGKTLFARREP